MDCPHCGTELTPELTHCAGCDWKVRLSQILVQPTGTENFPYPLPASDIYYLFADQFLEPALSISPIDHPEQVISARAPVQKKPLAIGLCRVAFIWLAVSEHLELELLRSRALTFARSRSVIAKPLGVYRAPIGSLESRILDSLYDRRQGFSVEATLVKLIGFWYQGDSYEWALQLVRQHLLASPCASDGRRIDGPQLEQLRPQVEYVKTLLNNFAFANPSLVAALWDSIQRGLDAKKG